MITYKNILYSVTKILSDNFNCDVIVENQEGTFENECFYVTLVPVTSKASTLKTNQKQLMLSIKYFGGSKLDNYDIADKLECLFARNLKVKDKFLNISNITVSLLLSYNRKFKSSFLITYSEFSVPCVTIISIFSNTFAKIRSTLSSNL